MVESAIGNDADPLLEGPMFAQDAVEQRLDGLGASSEQFRGQLRDRGIVREWRVDQDGPPTLRRCVGSHVVGDDVLALHADRSLDQCGDQTGSILPECAVDQHRPARQGVGDEIEYSPELVAAFLEHADVQVGDVARRVERRWVLRIDDLIDQRHVGRSRRLDEPGSALELRLLAQVDHQRQVEPADGLTPCRSDPDGIVGAEETTTTNGATAAGRPTSRVAEVDATVDVDVPGR